jgi:quaternary ammonium compound-resistance protein SugE
MAWIFLIIAGLLEVVWAYAMKQSQGFTRLGPTLIMLVTMAGSFGLLTLAVRSLPLGTAYAVWTGIGAIGAFIVGIVWLGETASVIRLVAAGMILSGLVTMKLASP